jgi:hypothetical protein
MLLLPESLHKLLERPTACWTAAVICETPIPVSVLLRNQLSRLGAGQDFAPDSSLGRFVVFQAYRVVEHEGLEIKQRFASLEIWSLDI